MKLKYLIGLSLYHTVGNIFPTGMLILGSKLGRPIKRLCGKLMLQSCGRGVNIESGATISFMVKIGDYSGIGKKSYLQGNIKIGDHVMMGPEVKMFTINHRFSDLTIPMTKQGTSEPKPIVIDDDVWIGSNCII